METNFATRKMTISIVSAILFLALLFHLFLYRLTKSPALLLCGLLYTALIIGLLGIYLLYMRRMITRFTDRISTTIEDMINGSDDPRLYSTTDTLLSKINHRLSRLYMIMMENQNLVSREKEALQELISDISHQVKTPIASLKMVNATLMDRKLPRDKRIEFLKAEEKQLEKLDFLMQSLIKTSRLEAGMFTFSLKRQSVQETLAVILYDVMLLAEKKNIDVEIDCDPDIDAVHDRKWTAEALFNILENAVKYTPDGGHIKVQVRAEEMYTKVLISDTGKGIAEEHYPKIFKRFYREQEVHDIEGIGVGLYLTRKIITLQDGFVTVRSAPGKGSEFTVGLPCRSGDL